MRGSSRENGIFPTVLESLVITSIPPWFSISLAHSAPSNNPLGQRDLRARNILLQNTSKRRGEIKWISSAVLCSQGCLRSSGSCQCLVRALGRPAELLWLFQGFYTLGGGGLTVFVLLNLTKTQTRARREEEEEAGKIMKKQGGKQKTGAEVGK